MKLGLRLVFLLVAAAVIGTLASASPQQVGPAAPVAVHCGCDDNITDVHPAGFDCVGYCRIKTGSNKPPVVRDRRWVEEERRALEEESRAIDRERGPLQSEDDRWKAALAAYNAKVDEYNAQCTGRPLPAAEYEPCVARKQALDAEKKGLDDWRAAGKARVEKFNKGVDAYQARHGAGWFAG